MSKKKRIDPIPEEFTSYEKAAEFWDTHDTTDYPDAFRTVKVVTEFRGRHYEIEIEEDVFKALRTKARQKGFTISQLANSILRRQLRMTMEIECICQTSENLKSDTRLNLDAFRALRNQCAALREILVPQDILDQFERFASEPRDEARHTSVILLALDRGCLSRITAPIHTFLLDGNTKRPEVTKQYLSDLRETWYRKGNVLERHRKSRIFLGRILELIFAYWLKSKGYDIKDLEATGGKCDIVADDPDEGIESFELKYIGIEDSDFVSIVQSLQGKDFWKELWIKILEWWKTQQLYPTVRELADKIGWNFQSLTNYFQNKGAPPKFLIEKIAKTIGLENLNENPNPYSAANYLLFRVFEAAKQIRDHTEAGSKKIAAVIISEIAWWQFNIPLIEGWIDWTNPKFFPGDKKWKEFLADQKQKNPQLEEELKPIIVNLDGIIFMLMGSDYEIALKKRVNLRR